MKIVRYQNGVNHHLYHLVQNQSKDYLVGGVVAKLADKDLPNKENTKSKDKRRRANSGERRRKREAGVSTVDLSHVVSHAKNRPSTERVFCSNELAVYSSSTVCNACAG